MLRSYCSRFHWSVGVFFAGILLFVLRYMFPEQQIVDISLWNMTIDERPLPISRSFLQGIWTFVQVEILQRKKEKRKTMLRWGKVSYFTWVTRTVHIWLTNLRPTECPFYPRLSISVYGYSKLLSATRRGKTSKQRGNTWETNSEPSSQKAAQ